MFRIIYYHAESLIAYDVLNVINDELYDKHKDGDFFVMMNSYEWFEKKSEIKDICIL